MRGQEIEAPLIDRLVRELRPDVSVGNVTVTGIKSYGDADNESSVSTSSQVRMEVGYDGQGGHNQLPRQLLAKLSFPDDIECNNPELNVWFENEVFFYNRVRPELDIETPIGMGGHFDWDSNRFILLMGDLGTQHPHINTMMDPPAVEPVRAVLMELAKLHARFWQSPRFDTDLAWVQNQVDGTLEGLFDGSVRLHIHRELARNPFKREFIEELGTTEAELYAMMKAIKRHQARLPQTLLHGDAHFGNSYLLPDGRGGLLDWQAFARGNFMHDVGYMIQTGLSVDHRRKHERDLLDEYREALLQHGAGPDVPDRETVWLEYRRSMIYGFHMGWITAPYENYGWECMVLGNHRTKAACMDHDSVRLGQQVL